MQPLEVLHVGDDYPQQVIEFAGHQVALHHLGDFCDGLLECGEFTLFLAVQRDVHKYVAGKAGLFLVEEGNIAANQPLFLQRTHAPQAGGLRQANRGGQLDVADAPVSLQVGKYRPVEFVQFHSRFCIKKVTRRQNMPLLSPFVAETASELRGIGGILLR